VGPVGVELGDGHRRALLGETLGDAAPDPAATAGDDGGLGVEERHAASLRRGIGCLS